MKNLKQWLKQALFDSDRVVKLQREVEELNEVVKNQKSVNDAYFKQKHILIKSNNELKKELEHTKEQLRIQTEMYKNAIKGGHQWEKEK
jgi:FtsZ-binding cell division protein ZapB